MLDPRMDTRIMGVCCKISIIEYIMEQRDGYRVHVYQSIPLISQSGTMVMM